MIKQEDPEFTSSDKHTRVMAMYREIIDEQDQNPAENIFHNQRYKEGTKTRQVGGKETWYS